MLFLFHASLHLPHEREQHLLFSPFLQLSTVWSHSTERSTRVIPAACLLSLVSHLRLTTWILIMLPISCLGPHVPQPPLMKLQTVYLCALLSSNQYWHSLLCLFVFFPLNLLPGFLCPTICQAISLLPPRPKSGQNIFCSTYLSSHLPWKQCTGIFFQYFHVIQFHFVFVSAIHCPSSTSHSLGTCVFSPAFTGVSSTLRSSESLQF